MNGRRTLGCLRGLSGVFSVAGLLVGCTVLPPIQGNGEPETESRELDSFTTVENASKVDVQVSSGQEQSVAVTCDSNLLPYIATEVSGDTLFIRVVVEEADASDIAPLTPCVVAIGVPGLAQFTNLGVGHAELGGTLSALKTIENRGSGDVTAAGMGSGDLVVSCTGIGDVTLSGDVNSDTFLATGSGSGTIALSGVSADTVTLTHTGSGDLLVGDVVAVDLSLERDGGGDVDIASLYASTLVLDHAGSGTVSLEAGGATTFGLTLSGDGDVDAEGVVASSLTATLSGSGDATVTVQYELYAELNGSGDLIVYGNPPVKHATASQSGAVVYR